MARISKGAQNRARNREINPPDNNWLSVGPITPVEDYPDDTYEQPERPMGTHRKIATIGAIAALMAFSSHPRR